MNRIILSLLVVALARGQTQDQYCLSWNDTNNQCKRCAFSVLQNGQCFSDITLRPNCLFYDRNDTTGAYCIMCWWGYYLDAQNQCQRISIPGCIEINTNNECLACEGGYLPDSSTNSCSSGSGDQPIPGCLYYSGTRDVITCQLCQSGYVIDQQTGLCRQSS